MHAVVSCLSARRVDELSCKGQRGGPGWYLNRRPGRWRSRQPPVHRDNTVRSRSCSGWQLCVYLRPHCSPSPFHPLAFCLCPRRVTRSPGCRRRHGDDVAAMSSMERPPCLSCSLTGWYKEGVCSGDNGCDLNRTCGTFPSSGCSEFLSGNAGTSLEKELWMW